MTFRTLGTKIFRQVFNQLWLLENSSALSMLEDSFLTIKCYNLIGKIPTITNLYISFILVSNAKYKTLFDCIFWFYLDSSKTLPIVQVKVNVKSTIMCYINYIFILCDLLPAVGPIQNRRTLIDRISSWPNGFRSILTENVNF